MEDLANLDSDICRALSKNQKVVAIFEIIWKRKRAVRAAHKMIFETESRSPFTVCDVHSKEGAPFWKPEL